MSVLILHRQRGVVLVTSLIFLVVVTMLVIATMGTNAIEERMAGNSRDRNMAFQAAEAALRDAMRDIQSARFTGETDFTTNCLAGLCLPESDGTPKWIDLNDPNVDSGWSTGANSGVSILYGAKTNAAALTDVPVQPRYIIEVLRHISNEDSLVLPKAKYFAYRATARGYSKALNDNNVPISQVTLQAVYTKP